MNDDRIKRAFGKVRAEEALKEGTKAFLSQKIKGSRAGKTVYYHRLIPAAACFLFLLFGGHWLYFAPAAVISIDINPSIELGVNRFDKIISVQGYNSDGQDLAKTLDIKYLRYTDAVSRIITSESVGELLSNNEVMTIGVIGPDDAQSQKMLSELETFTASEENTYCYYANSDEADEAHEMGLSCGKYRAYLKLRDANPEITVDEVQNMTMREIWDLIGNESDSLDSYRPHAGSESENGHGGHGAGSGGGHGRRNRYGAKGN